MHSDQAPADDASPDDDEDGQWFVYGRSTEDGMAFVRLREDVDADDHPAGFEYRVVCSLPIAASDGFPDDAEAEQLFAIEEQLELAVGDAGMFVGAVTENSKRHLFYYVRESFDVAVLESFVQSPPERKHDPAWADFTEWLVPSDSDRQINSDLHLIHILEEEGDDLSAVRPVDHFLYFDDKSDRDEVAISLSAQGEADLETSDDPESDSPYGIQFVREHALEPPEIFEHTLALVELASEHNGYYDGWETPLVKPATGE